MPLPVALGALGGLGGVFGRLNRNAALAAVGLGGQRGRTPAQNRRMRQSQVRDAEAMARAGDEFGVKLLRAWLGELPSLSVSRADYRSGVGQGKMPADGRELAQAALDRLKAEGIVTAAGNLSSGAKRGTGTKAVKATAASRGTAARKGTRARGGASGADLRAVRPRNRRAGDGHPG